MQTIEAALKRYPEFVNKVLRDWKVNGAAIAVASDGEIVFCEGFGLRDAARRLPVTDHTLFPQASVTKAFTTMALGILADEGLLDWDTPVRTYLPDFQLWDPFASERMTPRDLVTHRSGLPRHDLVWYHADFTREDMVRRLRFLQPTKDFRTFWQYQNMMYVTAGYLAGAVTGSTWEDVVRTRIFEPLGMVSSVFSVHVARQTPDFSYPYRKIKGKTEQIPFYEENDVMGPAGAIVSNLADMSQWLLLHLNQGKLAGGRLVSEGQISQMHAPQVVYPTPGRFQEMPQSSYGLGWFIEPYRGRRMVHHSGGINGFSTLVSFMPDEGVGVIALTNMNDTPAPYILTRNLFDRFLGLNQIPWNARFKEDLKQYESAEKRGKEKRVSDRVPRTRPSHRLEAYTGTFEHPAYGRVAIQQNANKLVCTYHDMELALKHVHYDVFETTIEEFEYPLRLQFHTDARGDIAQLSGPFEPTVADIVFTRAPDEAMTDRQFLERLAGTYQLLGFQVPVSFKGNVLQIALPGQPEYELIPVKGTEFALNGISDFSVEFQLDASGKVAGALLNQTGSVFEMKKEESAT